MNLIRAGQYSLRNGMRAGYNQIIRADVELFDRKRHKGEIAAILRFGKRQVPDKRGVRLFMKDEVTPVVREKIHETKQIGLRIEF